MSYCNFNISLFKPYVSHKTKIHPQVADDWELINKAYNTKDGVALKSKNLFQTIYDIPVRRFITFCKKYNVTIHGNKLVGDFVVGNDRSVYIQKDFDTWTDKYNKRVENRVMIKDAKPGHVYSTVCGMSVIYLGYMYEAKIKEGNYDDYSNFTNITKSHYVQTVLDFDDDDPVRYGVKTIGSLKLTRDLGYALDGDEIANIFDYYYYRYPKIVYWDKVRNKSPIYGMIPTIRKSITTQQMDNKQMPRKNTFYYTPLFAKDRKEYWALSSATSLANARRFDKDTLKYNGEYNSCGSKRYPSFDDSTEFYRIGVV